MEQTIDLDLAGCDCPDGILLHQRETFTNHQTGEKIPAITCRAPRCFCWRKA